MDDGLSGEYVDWNEMFGLPASADVNQPVISVPLGLFNADRDEIVTAARRHGFMRVLCIKDQANVHFCRYV
jgi:hypothetical protein